MFSKILLFIFTVIAMNAYGWETHKTLTKLTLQMQESWDKPAYEPIENILSSLSIEGKPAPTTRQALFEQLVIQGDKVAWEWQPVSTPEKPITALDILLYSVDEPDRGMDQNLRLADYQDKMGGYVGTTSQAIRHMYFPDWRLSAPLATFHIPFYAMGFAPQRAQLFFDLAMQLRNNVHSFWSYRFLGWGLHYLQDLCQPYHASQFGSFWLLPYSKLAQFKWSEFIAEATRIVSNFHLSYEQYTEFLLVNDPDGPGQVGRAFVTPDASEELVLTLKDPSVSAENVAIELALTSARLASKVVSAQNKLMGNLLLDPQMDIAASFFDSKGNPKIDFRVIEKNDALKEERQKIYSTMQKALSNTAVITKWYVDRYLGNK